MLAKDRHEKFASATIALHWIIAIGIVFMVPFEIWLDGQPNGDAKTACVSLHVSLSLLILVAGLLRLAWRMSNGLPQPVGNYPRWQRHMARTVHIILLIAPVYMPIGGILFALGKEYEIAVFGVRFVSATSMPPTGLEPIAHVMQGLDGFILALIALLHVAGALKHHFIDRYHTMRRMLGRPLSS